MNLLWDFSICGVPHWGAAACLPLPVCPPKLPHPQFCLCLSCSWFWWLVLAFCSSRATMCNKEMYCLPLPQSEKQRPWNILWPGVLWTGSVTSACASLWSLLSDLCPTDKACSQLWSHLKALTGWCAKCFASAERAWRRVESCENPSGSNLISSPGA